MVVKFHRVVDVVVGRWRRMTIMTTKAHRPVRKQVRWLIAVLCGWCIAFEWSQSLLVFRITRVGAWWLMLRALYCLPSLITSMSWRSWWMTIPVLFAHDGFDFRSFSGTPPQSCRLKSKHYIYNRHSGAVPMLKSVHERYLQLFVWPPDGGNLDWIQHNAVYTIRDSAMRGVEN